MMIKWSILNTAYPFEHSSKEKWSTVGITSVFLSLILILLQPFGFAPFSRIFLFLGYSFIGIICFSINYFSLPVVFQNTIKEKNWTIGKILLFFAYNFVFVGLWNHIYNGLVIINDPRYLISAYEILMTVSKTFVIGLIATAFYILIRYNFITRQHLQISQDLNQKLQKELIDSPLRREETIDLEIENRIIKLNRKNLLFISSEGNYLAFYMITSSSRTPKLYRGRIKKVEEYLENYPEFFRCHRSLIINVNYIKSTKGNSQGLSVKLFHHDEFLPVSRPNIKELRRLMDQNWSLKSPFIT